MESLKIKNLEIRPEVDKTENFKVKSLINDRREGRNEQKLSNEIRHRAERESLAIFVSSTFYDLRPFHSTTPRARKQNALDRQSSSLFISFFFFFIQTNLSTPVEKTTVEKTLPEESTPPSHDSCVSFEALLHLPFNISSTIFLASHFFAISSLFSRTEMLIYSRIFK